jgi:polyisoprenoid-binding protein YceI
MKKLLTTAAASLFLVAANAQVNWKVDNSHSKLGFSVVHAMVSETEGKSKFLKELVLQKQTWTSQMQRFLSLRTLLLSTLTTKNVMVT